MYTIDDLREQRKKLNEMIKELESESIVFDNVRADLLDNKLRICFRQQWKNVLWAGEGKREEFKDGIRNIIKNLQNLLNEIEKYE